jgi:predicted peptidase
MLQRATRTLIALAWLLPPFTACAQESGFLRRTVQVDSVTYKYQVYVPASFTKSRTWPVIFFLHGSAERGSDGERQTMLGLPARFREMKDFPAIVVMPQCAAGATWGDPAMERQAFAALEKSMQEFNGDPERLYLTGLSLGGYATWAFGYKYPDRFAALVPVCGGVVANVTNPRPWHPLSVAPQDPYGETASRLAKVPIWAFHGAADPRVPVSESRKLTEALKARGGNVRYTEYPGVAHNAWDRAYWEEELLPWLLAQRKPKE